jgi:mannitol 2-dehydrogenase
MSIALNSSTIDALPKGIQRNDIDRSKLVPGIAHIGVGAFHRAHQAVYLDDALAKSNSTEWGLVGIGLLPFDIPMRDACKKQDCLYTVNELAPNGTRNTRLIQCMIDFLYAPDDINRVLEKLSEPNIRIVSLTITEGGYLIDSQGEFVLSHPSIVADLSSPTLPATAFGLITEALNRRRQAGIRPFTVMSCDNLRHNGDKARKACLSYAKARDADLAAWIDANVSFPNGMVDRITPATSPDIRKDLNANSGVDDQIPVICEQFKQWVLEDNFKEGRPAFELAGVTLTDDVMPYEDAKIRLLNGSHGMLAYPAFLAGLRTVDDAMNDSLFVNYLRNFLNEDAGPHLKSIPGMDLELYKETLLSRFSNPAIEDQLARLCMDGGSKIQVFLLPTILSNFAAGRNCPRMAFLLACYNHYIHTDKDDLGEEYTLREPNAMESLKPIIASSDPMALLQSSHLLGDTAAYPEFVDAYLSFVNHLKKDGIRQTLQSYDSIVTTLQQ